MALASRASASIPQTSGSPVKGPETTGQASSVSNAHQNGSQHKGVMNKNAPQNGGRGHQNTKRDLSAIHGIRRPPSDGRRRIMKQEGRRVVTRSRSPSSASVASYWGRDENANRVETITGLANFGKGSLLGAFSQLGERFGLARNNLIVVSRNQRRSCWQRQQRPPQAAGQRSIQQLL
jgi:hypothetical protein